jgi:acetylornithine/N-succinyldiaminopimelate aminotransferase
VTGLLERWQAAVMDTYGTPPIALVHGRGAEVWDEAGNRYLDLLAGIAVNALGHAHPAIVEAVSTQLTTLGHTSNLYATEPAIALAERLQQLLEAPAARTFFANSGTEANECALKIARLHGGPGGRIVAAERSFHGRSMGALSVTGNPAKREPFAPLPYATTFVPYGDVEALRAAMGPDVSALILEPTLGEAGVIPPPADYLRQARASCDDVGALLILDEVQGGVGRTGRWFAFQAEPGLVPDVVTMAKGLGAGLPIGACVALTDVAATALGPGMHGATFGGNPVCAAAALATLATIESEGLLEHAATVGDHLAGGIDHPLVHRVDGVGLWRGLQLAEPVAPAVEKALRHSGFLVNAAVPDRVRLAPPLIFTEAQADEFLAALPAALDSAQTGGTP